MSTVPEIESAIEQLPPAQMLEVAAWPEPPPNVLRAESERIGVNMEAAFPTKRN